MHKNFYLCLKFRQKWLCVAYCNKCVNNDFFRNWKKCPISYGLSYTIAQVWYYQSKVQTIHIGVLETCEQVNWHGLGVTK